MFEKIVLRSSDDRISVTAGQLAEALLFYRQVHLVLNEQTIVGLVSRLGVDIFLDLFQRPNVSAVFVAGNPGTISIPVGPLEVHGFGFISSALPRQEPGKKVKTQRFGFEILLDYLLRKNISQKDATRIILGLRAKVPHQSLEGKKFLGSEITRDGTADVLDENFFHDVTRTVLLGSVPESAIPKEFKIKAIDSDFGFYIFTDLDFEKLEEIRQIYAPDRVPLTKASLANEVLSARLDLSLAAHYGGDFITSSVTSNIIRLRYSMLMKRQGIHAEQLSQFHDLVLDNCPTVAEAIDSGERSFADFLSLLDRSGKFKDWINDVHPDMGVARAYLEEVSRQDWIQSPKGKLLRYVVGVASGFSGVGAIVGTGIAFADSFILEKLFGSWRPSHFVSKRLQPFVDGGETVSQTVKRVPRTVSHRRGLTRCPIRSRT